MGRIKMTALAVCVVGIGVFAGAPSASADGLLNGLSAGNTPNQGGYQPPEHGTDVHGQGTVGTVDISPDESNPQSGNPYGGPATEGEEVVIGRSRAQRGANGGYSADANILSVGGNEILGTHADQGETDHGPLQPVQAQVLDPLCTGLGHLVCVKLLTADASASDSGASSQTELAQATIGGDNGVKADVGESDASTSQDDNGCTTSTGHSQLAGIDLGNGEVTNVTESGVKASSCGEGPPPPDPDENPSRDSAVISLLGVGLPIPAGGCSNGTPNADLTALSPIISTSCNSDDGSNNSPNPQQDGATYAVREALNVFVVEGAGSALAKLTLGGAEANSGHSG